MDKKIQDAASDQQPPFQEKDWNRMESLLDKHLPQEKKKRPFFLWLLFLLLVGTPVLLMLTTYKRPPDLVAEKISSPAKAPSGTPSAVENPLLTPGIPGETERPVTEPLISKTGSSQKPLFTSRPSNQRERQPREKEEKTLTNPGLPVQESNEPSVPLKTPTTREETETTAAQGSTTINAPAVPVPATDSAIKTDTVTGKDNPPSKEKEEEPVAKNKTPKSNKTGGKLQINFSAGPDLTMVGMNKTGQWKMQYGIGLSYALSKRWQIRTGFLASRKLYTADSSDYHPPKNFWNYYTNLQKIDADCLVFEIPVNVVYTFPSTKKHQWFVSAGVSSYLMKEENYEYYYKNSWGQPAYRSWSTENENNHFFSILQLSGGYQYNFSERFSLMTEPYLKLPLGGVGFGKVKLSNTGVLFTVGYKPFLKKGK